MIFGYEFAPEVVGTFPFLQRKQRRPRSRRRIEDAHVGRPHRWFQLAARCRPTAEKSSSGVPASRKKARAADGRTTGRRSSSGKASASRMSSQRSLPGGNAPLSAWICPGASVSVVAGVAAPSDSRCHVSAENRNESTPRVAFHTHADPPTVASDGRLTASSSTPSGNSVRRYPWRRSRRWGEGLRAVFSARAGNRACPDAGSTWRQPLRASTSLPGVERRAGGVDSINRHSVCAAVRAKRVQTVGQGAGELVAESQHG